ncbi:MULTISPECIES: cytochrome c3 family protein [Stigmatella]|jgi:hypothetical protein|uniref:Quinol:cytochrome c oxidoreductase pentaheme cytochrome subunit n=2 Tax=Stigmatella TaxID=40 RepID=A0A1H7SJN4_STIAU|nr:MULTISPECIES: cytochrome c3 family protein [Stigmatella]SEL72850.1 quinol:cytochrome c oxidoreductase pentaheme cytochrome subunit [Stigmatella aurantiaca]SEU36735.1 quinol:cytochrome c oxidoreductase pentaheme cytochrome subunit [Stigmatella erecta]
MSGPLFPRWTNTVSRLSVAGLFAVPALSIGGLLAYARSPHVTNQNQPIEQPIEFDHRHHAGDEQIDCRYCHWTVESAPSAGIPSTTVCMSCHAQIWNKSPYLTEVRKAYFADQPIPWVRVHNLPDFVYFNHAIHVNKGVGCATCHGRVDQMAAIHQASTLTMAWCLDCHRDPKPHLRPAEYITSMTWTPPADPKEAAALGETLAKEYEVHSRTSCSTCHR